MKAGWEIKTLDHIAENLDSKRIPITKSDRKSGAYPYYGASGIVDYVADYIFDCDTLLVSEDGANLIARSTPIAFPASGKYWVNNHAHILKFDNMTTQRFVELYLESIPLDDYITGAAQPKLNQKALNSIPIPYPPLPEQQRIVGILDEAFEGIATVKANAEKNLRNARALFESHLNEVFSQRGVGWNCVRIEDACESIIDCVNKTAPKVDEPTPYKMIRTTNIRNGYVNLESVYYVTEDVYRVWTRRQIPQRGDVILTREAPMGEIGMLLSDEKVFLGQRLVSYRVNSSKLMVSQKLVLS